MKVYHNYREVKRLIERAKNNGYERRFVVLHRTIPETHLFKGNIIEFDEYDKQTQTYIINTGYGNLNLWKSMAKEVR